ncbi:hypothetical protein [Streptomyces zhihengii]|uniref:Uncharacterized protein n=1 Tax=Streptomyces zhihengii TaxID=1818004 RepID=A0ABS2URJ8_9ACTN|nr:hypothetical protein [Streptomyces zhihengii]MBM9619497.1 hypothetical protein [Streptomyces zhihengii]
MTVDPSEPDTFDEDDRNTAQQDSEVPEADAAEQHTDIRQDRDDPVNRADPDAANEADAAEQARVVTLDEDDYR